MDADGWSEESINKYAAMMKKLHWKNSEIVEAFAKYAEVNEVDNFEAEWEPIVLKSIGVMPKKQIEHTQEEATDWVRLIIEHEGWSEEMISRHVAMMKKLSFSDVQIRKAFARYDYAAAWMPTVDDFIANPVYNVVKMDVKNVMK